MLTENDMQKAVALLQAGELVAFPTETVYGLGADASNPVALLKIFAAKGRPVDHPLIVHIADVDQLNDWAREVSPRALKLAAEFWPGPLTLILKKHPEVSELVTGEQDTIGIRIPYHPVALSLLQAFKGGLAGPSANRFGRISPTTATAVKEELGTSVQLVLDGGQCAVGVESTIVDVSGDEVVILRPGRITADQIEELLGEKLGSKTATTPRVSGALESHYAPQTPTFLVTPEKLLSELTTIQGGSIGVLSFSPAMAPAPHWINMPYEAESYARELYLTLRALDKLRLQSIWVEEVPESVAWDAVRDRLNRACS
jgi:L-threonylcarbamoyladenylate synthase